MTRHSKLGLCLALLFLSLSALAVDNAVLRNGFSILHQRREVLGDITRLYISNDQSNFVDIPTAAIDHIEIVPDPPVPAAKNNEPAADQKTAITHPFDLAETVKAASGTYSLDPDLVTSVIRAESAFNVRAVSPKGAQGLMQLMPQTASELGVRNAFDPEANVQAGTHYLRELLERYNFDLIKALAAYNAGPLRVEQYNGVPPYYETRAYVARIVRDFNKKKLAAQSATSTSAAKKTPQKASQKASKKQGTAIKPTSAKSQTRLASSQSVSRN